MRDTGGGGRNLIPTGSPSPQPSFTPLAPVFSSLPPFLLLPLFQTLPLGSLFGVPSSWALHQGPLKGHRASSQPLILADFSCADLSSVTWENQREQRSGQQSVEEGSCLVASGGYREATHPAGTLEREEKRETLGSGKGRISGTALPQPLLVEVCGLGTT